jgi:hypothetical protein
VRLELSDLHRDKRLLHIRLGKGRKDRVVPVGARAMQWIEKYLDDVRPLLTSGATEQALFLTGYGQVFNADVLGREVVKYIEKANIGRRGGPHLFRHTCATHMLEGGADIRYIQQLLGHENLETTAIYTEVSIIQLQAVHARCHPAERRETPEKEARSSSLFSRPADPPKAEVAPFSSCPEPVEGVSFRHGFLRYRLVRRSSRSEGGHHAPDALRAASSPSDEGDPLEKSCRGFLGDFPKSHRAIPSATR